LERLLEDVDLDQRQLGEVIGALRQLDREDVYLDMAELNRLQSQIVEGLKQVEFAIRRELEGEDEDRVFVSGSDEVPTGFRQLVEEYYRALSRSPSN
jgi:flagellar motor switch protein FliG